MVENPDYVLDRLIEKVINTYPASQWLIQIKEVMPDAGDVYIMSTIEILCGGDLKTL